MLHVHRAASTQMLLDALGGVLRVPLDDPLTVEPIAVHSRGFERWVAQGLAHHLGTADGDDGIAIGLDFPFPGRLVGDVVAEASGLAAGDDPWTVDRTAWWLLRLLERDPSLAADTPLAHHLAGDQRGRLPAIRRIADRFDRYAVHRPAMLRRWAQGPDAAAVDVAGATLPHRLAWQAGLWRALRDHLVEATGVTSPPERLPDVLARIEADPDALTLPARLHLFGLTSLPAGYLDVLQAVAVHRDVHLFLAHPSPTWWEHTVQALATSDLDPDVLPRRADDPTRTLARHPLLRGWARDAREMAVVLASRGVAATAVPATSAGAPGTAATPPATLLQRLQDAIARDVAPPGPPPDPADDERRALVAGDDRSVEVQACHGRRRQVEVLRDLEVPPFAQA
ncbi:MAG: exodeoxyribonuclease V subunit gamma, partial [Nitriliruptoraceae bacterium]|nr:exodeoxyribonuclease V subunit gamma [Nitriliruptoraceae bacterium]